MNVFLIEMMTINPWLFLAVVVAAVLIVEQIGRMVIGIVDRCRPRPQWDHCEHCTEIEALAGRVDLLEQDALTGLIEE